MLDRIQGKTQALLAWAVIALLVVGGLGWATRAALELEQQQIRDAAEAERAGRVRTALWRLDSRMFPILAREAGRPYHHYSAVYASPTALRQDGRAWPAGVVLEPSPLLREELPSWMRLHFQTDLANRWTSPQVLSEPLGACLMPSDKSSPLWGAEPLGNVGPDKSTALAELRGRASTSALAVRLARLAAGARVGVERPPAPPDFAGTQAAWEQQRQAEATQNSAPDDYTARSRISQDARSSLNRRTNNNEPPPTGRGTRPTLSEPARSPITEPPAAQVVYDDPDAVVNNILNGELWLSRPPTRRRRDDAVEIRLGAMVAVWLPASDADRSEDRLVLARRMSLGNDRRVFCQGVLLDWPTLRAELLGEVTDLLPAAELRPIRTEQPTHPERAMSALPVELDAGPAELAELPSPGWTPLRLGLAACWAAAALALLTVGLGGWSLADLAERRMRFVSAVTHELRTPLTTLRLYTDMLTGGMVTDEGRRAEYLRTLHTETERLNRLVSNVLDFARLEGSRPKLQLAEVGVRSLLEQAEADWRESATAAGKRLVLELSELAKDAEIRTDASLVGRILGNLIDNACKYSRDAADERIVVRASRCNSHLTLTVEDFGPGVPAGERRSIWRPFRRGSDADSAAGGVGLGLALARRWASLLGGDLSLCPDRATGACFALRLPS